MEWVLARRDVRLRSLFFAEGASLDGGSPVEKGLRWKGIDMAKVIFNHLEHFIGNGWEASRLMSSLLRRISSTYPFSDSATWRWELSGPASPGSANC